MNSTLSTRSGASPSRQLFPLTTVVILLSTVAIVDARNSIRSAFFNAYPSAVGTILDDQVASSARTVHCGVCHYDFDGGGNRNLYGLALEAEYDNNGKDADAAIQAIRFVDSDGDGHTNEFEVIDTTNFVNTPTFPGLTPANVNQVVGVGDLDDINGFLVPSAGGDSEPPEVAILHPNGGEVLLANTATNIVWTSEDDSGVAGVNIYLSLDAGSTFTPLAFGVLSADETNSYPWFPANRPSSNALIRIEAVDNVSNSTYVDSASVFVINSPTAGPTTLRDFDMPGSQPHELIATMASPQNCAACHGNYNTNHEPYFNWQGSMMAHASIDPLYEANQAIANQDAPDSGDLCLRCHIHAGWVEGRSVPTSGEAMLESDKFGVACDMCHRMMDPIYKPGSSPTNDLDLLASLINPGTNYGNGMVHLDPEASRRGPFSDATNAPHSILVSPFHQEGAFCGTCHDVSNPVFEKDENGVYQLNAMDTPPTELGPHKAGPVERTYSEWLFSEFNTPSGVYLPQFAGNKTNGMVASCQDCHMRDVAGHGADPNQFDVPLRQDLPLHDMTGGSVWMPLILADLYPSQVNSNAAAAGSARATALLQNAADLAAIEDGSQLKVTVTNNCGHKLPTGYPEGRRMWLNVQFYDAATNLLSESGAYDTNTAVLSHDAEAKIYEVHPGIDTNISDILGLPTGPSFHFVLNNKIFEDNRIPPRGFLNAAFESFGGAPVGHTYADGQYWDDTLYSIPQDARSAEVKLYYQSTSKEFVEFLRDENVTNDKGQIMYEIWSTNGMCPPTLMQETTWLNPFLLTTVAYTPEGYFRADFHCRTDMQYTVEYTDALDGSDTWHAFANNGTHVPTGETSFFEDDFTGNTSGGPPAGGMRFYRFSYTPAP
jgi:hypothetical protein